jgi:predicted nucleic acid-binding protein
VRLWLVDTGPLVAYLDADDPAHGRVVESLDAFAGRIGTTSAVVTEAMHFARRVDQGPRRLVELLEAADATVVDFTRPADLAGAVALMEQYASVPMDFADATLVLLAEALGVQDVATLDRRGFSAYRLRRGRAFRLVLAP